MVARFGYALILEQPEHVRYRDGVNNLAAGEFAGFERRAQGVYEAVVLIRVPEGEHAPTLTDIVTRAGGTLLMQRPVTLAALTIA